MSLSELAARLGLPLEQVAAWPSGRAPRTTIGGVHLIVETGEDFAALVADTSGITCSDRDNREPDFERHDTEPCGPPDGE
jgi:hypothetical protein